jgi:hypothetical protein
MHDREAAQEEEQLEDGKGTSAKEIGEARARERSVRAWRGCA